MSHERTSLRWYRIIAENKGSTLPFAKFYKEHFGGETWPRMRES